MTLQQLAPPGTSAGLDQAGTPGRFRRTLHFNLATGGLATGLEILPDATVTAAFAGRDVDALADGAPEHAQLSAGPAGLVVALPTARRLLRVLLSAQPVGEVEAFRFDGPVVSEKPISSKDHDLNVGAALDVVDRQLILRRTSASLFPKIDVAEVKKVFLRYDAVNPQLGFALPADEAGVEFLTVEPVPSAAPPLLRLSAGAAFAAALSARIRRFADGRTGPLPDPLAVDLVLEADLPCLGTVEAFQFGYALTHSGFADSAEKQKLRFPGERRTVERVELRIPATADLLSAPITFSQSAGPEVVEKAVADSPSEPVAANDAVPLLPGGPVAARVELAEARVVTGAQAQLAALEGTTVIASLWEDDGKGLPGRKLVESAAITLRSGRPTSIPFVFAAPEALPAGPAWLAFSAERGRAALALGADPGGAVALGTAAGFSVLPAADARGGAVRLLYAPLAGETAGPSPGLALALGGTAIAFVARDGVFEADLAPGLNALGRPRPERIALEIASERRSVVTVDPPLFRYSEGA